MTHTERIKKVTLYCLKNSSIIIPVVIVEVLIVFINQFGNYNSDETNLFDFFNDPFENADKLYTTLISLFMIMSDQLKNTLVPYLLSILGMMMEEAILVGMVYLSLKNGFTTLSDFWTALKRYAGKVILIYFTFYVIVVLLLLGLLYLLVKLIYLIGVNELVSILAILGFIFLFVVMILAFVYYVHYAVYCFIEQKKVKRALGRFFKDTSRCWLKILPVMLGLDMIGMLLKTIFKNLDFLFLLDTLNTCIVNTLILFFQIVYMISCIYSNKRPENMNTADDLIVVKKRARKQAVHNI